MNYYYSKDKNGREMCWAAEDIQKDAKGVIEHLAAGGKNGFLPGIDTCLTYVSTGDVMGYESLDAYIADKGRDDFAIAVQDGFDCGYKEPFVVMRMADGSFLANPGGKEVDWYLILQEYCDRSYFSVAPRYYNSETCSLKVVEFRKMNLLAQMLRAEMEG